MFFTSILNSGIGTNSVLSCILCSPTNVSGPQHSLVSDLSPLTPPQLMDIRER